MGQGLGLHDLSGPVLYDVFQDAAAVLTGLYVERQRRAVDESVAAQWWGKVMALRDEMRAVDPADEATQIDCVTRWRREAADLAA